MIPPQSLGDAVKAEEAFEVVAGMRPEKLATVDDALWQEWNGLQVVLEASGSDKSAAFVTFLQEEYFKIMKEALGTNAKETSFVPPISADTHATAEET